MQIPPKSRISKSLKVAVALSFALVGLTACNGSKTDSQSGNQNVPPTAIQTTASPSQSAAPVENSLKTIGTVSVTSPGVQVITDISVGSATMDPALRPSETILNACNWNYSSTLATSAWIHGELTIRYLASVPESINYSYATVENSSGPGLYGTLAIINPATGECTTNNLSSVVLRSMGPNTNEKVEFWVIIMRAISNAHPTFSADDVKGLIWQTALLGSDQLANRDTKIVFSAAPGATLCNTSRPGPGGGKGLLLYYKNSSSC